jgi:hypothetical protein
MEEKIPNGLTNFLDNSLKRIEISYDSNHQKIIGLAGRLIIWCSSLRKPDRINEQTGQITKRSGGKYDRNERK